MFGHVGEQGDVAVGKGGDDVAGLEPGQAGNAVGPGGQAVPGVGEPVEFGVGEVGEAEFGGEGFDGGAVQGVQVGPGEGAAADLVHGGGVGGAPGVGEGGGIEVWAPGGEFGDEAAAPVDHGAEDVEEEGFYGHLSVFQSKMWKRPRRKPGVNALNGLTDTDGLAMGPRRP